MSELPALPLPWSWVAPLLLLLSVAFLILSALLERSGPIRIRHWVEEAGGGLKTLYEAPTRFEAFRLLVSLLAKAFPLALLAAVVALLAHLLPWPGALAGALAVVLAVILAVEIASRMLVGRDPEGALRRLTGVYRFCLVLLGPMLLVFAPLLPRAVLERRGEDGLDEASEEEIEAFIRVGAREGILEPDDAELLRGVVVFGDTQVRSVMTPRIDMVCAPVETDLESLLGMFLESKHSRIPVYRESIDHIVGILHIRDVLQGLQGLQDEEPKGVEELAGPVSFVPETKRLDDLLRELQSRHRQMAVVVDEYGGTAGVVTVEDLVEEIVGEIADEHEVEDPINELLHEGCWRVDGRANLEVLDELFGVDVEDVPYETVGGLIFNELGYVPKAGTVLESHGLKFTVALVEGRRVLVVLVERKEGEEEVGEAEPEESLAEEGGRND